MNELIQIWEHFEDKKNIKIENGTLPESILFPKKRKPEEAKCIEIKWNNDNMEHYIKASYYIGVDWISPNQAIYVAPKLNTKIEENANLNIVDLKETDYLKMLFSAFRHVEVSEHTNELFDIKFDKPLISITQKQDLLTPLLVIQFLSVVKNLVRKGLKKSYYKVEQNLVSRIKGKILIAQNIKQNRCKNKQLHTFCTYEEFGYNGLENRLLKKTLVFIQRNMSSLNIHNAAEYTSELFNFINPAFAEISDKIELSDIKHAKTNAFYKEYGEAIRLARLILKRFGYNISQTVAITVETPPFWIDMSKLFELYVLGLLKDKFPKSKEIQYHFTTHGNELDYLLNSGTYKMVIDAKYKPKYDNTKITDDIRQLSGYARLEKVYNDLGKNKNEIIDCLIIYPNQENGVENLGEVDFTFSNPENKISGYVGFYKLGVKLPII
jgi:5-methylcytosine-specific restriction enzyme subunit McrC